MLQSKKLAQGQKAPPWLVDFLAARIYSHETKKSKQVMSSNLSLALIPRKSTIKGLSIAYLSNKTCSVISSTKKKCCFDGFRQTLGRLLYVKTSYIISLPEARVVFAEI